MNEDDKIISELEAEGEFIGMSELEGFLKSESFWKKNEGVFKYGKKDSDFITRDVYKKALSIVKKKLALDGRKKLKTIYKKRIKTAVSCSRFGLTRSEIEKKTRLTFDQVDSVLEDMIKRKQIEETKALRYKKVENERKY